MITPRFQKKKINLPTCWLDVSFADADSIGELIFDNVVLHYFGVKAAQIPPIQLDQLKVLLSFLEEDPPKYEYKGKRVLEESLYEWYLITRDFWKGVEKYEGSDIRNRSLVDVLSICEHYQKQIQFVDKAFSELKEDLRTDIEKRSQPKGYWDAVQDEMLFQEIGCSLTDDPFEQMKRVPLWRYFSNRLLLHKTAKSAKRQQELMRLESN